MLDDVTSLDQIKWIFDGRKVTQRQLTENITNAIRQWNVPDRITNKWVKEKDMIESWKEEVISVFIVK